MQYKSVLVTGGCGFIGSHFVEQVLKNHPESKVINLDLMTYAAHPATSEYLMKLSPERYHFVKGDIRDGQLILKLIKEHGVDAIVNFAAETHVDRSILNPGIFVETNILGVQNLLSLAKDTGARYVQVSTDEVYGTLNPEDPAFTENTPLAPNSPYAASKAGADLLVRASYHTYHQDVVITRCSNNYGGFQFPEKLIPLVIANAVENQPVPVYGDGKQIRDWIHVEDHARGILAALTQGKAGEVYNFGADQEKFNIDTVKAILKILGKSESLINYVGDRPGHDRRYAVNSTKAKNELGWTPKYAFHEGIEKTVAWYQTNTEWWKTARDKDYMTYYQANYAEKFRRPV